MQREDFPEGMALGHADQTMERNKPADQQVAKFSRNKPTDRTMKRCLLELGVLLKRGK